MKPINCNWSLAARCQPAAGDQRLTCQLDGGVLYVHGQVGDRQAGLDSGAVVRELAELGDRPLRVSVNSEGGYLFDGLAIYNALASYPGRVTAEVLGMAASAASLILLAADRVEMARGASILIHLSRVLVEGPAPILRDVAQQLDRLDQQLAELYADRLQLTAEEAYSLLRGQVDGTLYTPAEAIEAGLADGMLGSERAAAAIAGAKIRLQTARLAVE